MANVTDPLSLAVHGTNPQNLIEYITRQKIYDSNFWKEECFGLSAQDIVVKAATRIKCIGGTYGPNSKPTRFLSLALKMLQVGVEDDVLEEFLQNEDLKYVRLLGMFYLRLTGRPSDIYEKLECMYNDYRKVRYRTSTGWKLIHVDEFAHELLSSTKDSNPCCGISLPRLPKREPLVEAGYLEDEERVSALGPDTTAEKAMELLELLASSGNESAKRALEDRRAKENLGKKEVLQRKDEEVDESGQNNEHENEYRGEKRMDRRSRSRSWGRDEEFSHRNNRESSYHHRDRMERGYDTSKRQRDRHGDSNYRSHQPNHGRYSSEIKRSRDDRDVDHQQEPYSKKHRHDHRRDGSSYDEKTSKQRNRKKDKAFSSLFKKGKNVTDQCNYQPKEPTKRVDDVNTAEAQSNAQVEEGSIEYWNMERAKLGLKPLKEKP